MYHDYLPTALYLFCIIGIFYYFFHHDGLRPVFVLCGIETVS